MRFNPPAKNLSAPPANPPNLPAACLPKLGTPASTTVAATLACTLLFTHYSPNTHAADKEPTAWEIGPTGTQVSLRGLDAFDDQHVWASGGSGVVIRSIDGGSSWTNCSPAGYSEIDFRCVVTLGKDTALIASAGTPAVLLRTTDAGATWKKVYENASPNAFFDSMKFWDPDRGIAMSDPIDGRLLVIVTTNGGTTWQEVPADDLPQCRESEAAFAASNSSIALGEGGQVWIGMGGTTAITSRVYYRSGWNAKFVARSCPLRSSPTEGIFALAAASTRSSATKLIAVGGDYRDNKLNELLLGAESSPDPPAAFTSDDDGTTWIAATTPPARFRSAVTQLPDRQGRATGFITTGPTGSEFSQDGSSWKPIDGLGFHALAVGGQTVFACGSDGRFAVLVWE